MAHCGPRSWFVATLLGSLLVLAAPSVAERDPAGASTFRVRISRPELATAVRAALAGAARRVERDSCRSIFTDFADLAGRPLRARLETLSVSPAEYLQFIGFYDGEGETSCARPSTMAITVPGSLAVWICPQFAVQQRRDPGLAQTIVIHETLHSLGLGENPPSSADITARVVARCGR
jgi:hypothetical protein